MAAVRSVMIQVPALRASDPIFVALDEMQARGLSFMPVLREDGSLYGLVTEGDLIRLIYRSTRGAGEGVPSWLQGAGREMLALLSIQEVITKDVDAIAAEASLEEAAEMMMRNRRKVLPVFDSSKPVGYLTRAAIINAILK